MSAALVGAVAGAAIGVVAAPVCAWLPRGIPERLPQPRWTRWALRPGSLAACGTAAGLALGLAADAWLVLAAGLVLVAVLVPATAIDMAWRVVPDSLIVLGAVATGILLIAGRPGEVIAHVAAAAAAGGVALLVALASRGGLGLGDVKLLALLGFALGGAVVSAAAFAIATAAAAAVAVLPLRGRGATVPLVPFLAFGALLAAAGVRAPAVPV